MRISFPGGKKVYADYKGFTIKTDQPVKEGGDGSAPAPFDLFLAAIGTCAGLYILGFCQQRGINTEGLEVIQSVVKNPESNLIGQVQLEIRLPHDFPKKYKNAIAKAAKLCTVKKHLEKPPHFTVVTT